MELTEEEGAVALDFAKKSLYKHVANQAFFTPKFSEIFFEKRGCFVTLTKNNNLRGCIGFPMPVLPLYEAIDEASKSAALHDPRFRSVTPEELPDILVEVTILTEPIILNCAPESRDSKITVGKHGLIVKEYGRSGLLLPQVPVEWGWNEREFLNQTCNKAGLPEDAWLSDSVQVLTFEGQIFSEKSK